MRELDVLLMRYMDREYGRATAVERAAFERLLNLQDPEIQALLAGRLPADDPALDALVQRLLQHPGAAL
jgi:succinate dehydrogenase flavin-adding protein (antitoxin of CptAB toxin-antitoxin module)